MSRNSVIPLDDGWSYVPNKKERVAIHRNKKDIKTLVGRKKVATIFPWDKITPKASTSTSSTVDSTNNTTSSRKRKSDMEIDSAEDQSYSSNKKMKHSEREEGQEVEELGETRQQQISTFFVVPGEYHPMRDLEYKNLISKYKLNIPVSQAREARKFALRTKVENAASRLSLIIPTITKMYENDQKDIMEISRIIDFPPVASFRSILVGKGFSDEQIKEAFRSKALLSKRDAENLQVAQQNDEITRDLIKGESVPKKGTRFESKLAVKLRMLGLSFVTETDLEDNQYATPDILFSNPSTISGVDNLRWLDAKSFYGDNNDHVISMLLPQAQKYLQSFGKGGFVLIGYDKALQKKMPDGIRLFALNEIKI